MNCRNEYLGILKKMSTICAEYGLGDELTQAVNMTTDDIEKFKIKVPLMGGFNAGKSSLLNAFIGRDELLPTAIKAETAIAAELKFGGEEFIVAHDRHGHDEQFSLDEIGRISPQKYSYIEVIINSEQLKQYEDIVFVDMPGLDSDIKDHNQAILSYLNDGSHFFLLADIEHQVRGTIMDFVRNEITPLGFDFSVILTKSDAKDPDELETIRLATAEQLQFQTGRKCLVNLVSAHSGDIEEFVNLVRGINLDHPVQVRFQPRLLELIIETQRSLMIRRSCVFADTGEIEDKIRELHKNKQALSRKIAAESRALDRQFSETVLDAILYDLGEALHLRLDSLVVAAKAGNDAFGRAVAGIVRPALMQSSQARINTAIETSLENIHKMQVDLTQQNLDIDFSGIDNKLKQLNSVLTQMKHPWVKTILTSLAILTNVVGPWIELIIIFAPGIFSRIIGLLNNQDAKIKEKILTEVIPQIQGKIRDEIRVSLQTIKEEFLRVVEDKIISETKIIEDSLLGIETERSHKIEDEKSALAHLDQGLSLINELTASVQKRANS
jgi:GTP-binding protein EngB required for normal cell division